MTDDEINELKRRVEQLLMCILPRTKQASLQTHAGTG